MQTKQDQCEVDASFTFNKFKLICDVNPCEETLKSCAELTAPLRSELKVALDKLLHQSQKLTDDPQSFRDDMPSLLLKVKGLLNEYQNSVTNSDLEDDRTVTDGEINVENGTVAVDDNEFNNHAENTAPGTVDAECQTEELENVPVNVGAKRQLWQAPINALVAKVHNGCIRRNSVSYKRWHYDSELWEKWVHCRPYNPNAVGNAKNKTKNLCTNTCSHISRQNYNMSSMPNRL